MITQQGRRRKLSLLGGDEIAADVYAVMPVEYVRRQPAGTIGDTRLAGLTPLDIFAPGWRSPLSDPPRLILASGSPRRRDVLRQLGLEFEVRVSAVDEARRPGEGPAETAERLARAKAAEWLEPGALTLGFDTLVAHRGDVLGKPAGPREAIEMVNRLAADEHTVYTGIALADPDRMTSSVETTRVRFRPLQEGECEAYVATGEPLDKAGAYGIQGLGASLVESIQGDFFNVMGFPMQRFLELLGRHGWTYAFGALQPRRRGRGDS